MNTQDFIKANQDKIPERYDWLRLMVKDKETKTETLTGPHILRILGDEKTSKKNAMGFMEDVMIYKFKEKLADDKYRLVQYAMPLWAKDKKDQEIHYLVIRMSEFNVGDIIVMEMHKSGIKNFVNITKYNPESASATEKVIDIDNEDIPVVEDDDEIKIEDIPF
jgi:hypothetical protein